jgi:hypothetical protein
VSIVDNRKAYHDYFIEEKFEAGLALEGWEVKAIPRTAARSSKEAYVIVKDGEIKLIGAHITPLTTASTHVRRRSHAHALAPLAQERDQPSSSGRSSARVIRSCRSICITARDV